MASMKVLVACEFSQVVTKAFRDRGHAAYSCDLVPTEGDSSWHIQDDVLEWLDGYWDMPNYLLGDGLHHKWDMLIAFPPCTFLANSGVRWLINNEERHKQMIEACKFFNALLNAPIEKICIENPIQHKYARGFIRRPDQIIQPYHFGNAESKATCLWLKGLPPLMAKFTGGEGIKQSIWHEPPSENRKANRSRTFQGIAEAMAKQWGEEING